MRWREGWRRVQPWEYVLDGVAAAGVVVTNVLRPPSTARWTGAVLLDEPIRDALRLRSSTARDSVGFASDVLLATLATQAVLVDVVLVAWVGHGRRAVAGQMAAMDFEAAAIAAVLSGVAKLAFGRQRPFARGCAGDPDYDEACGQPDENASFFSGHTAVSWALASAMCAHHQHLPLYGSVAGDVLGCVGAAALATTTSMLRIVADQHWFSDVFVGAGIGVLSGYLLPRLLHYLHGDEQDREPGASTSARVMLAPALAPDSVGLSLAGAL